MPRLPDFREVGTNDPKATYQIPTYSTDDPVARAQEKLGASLQSLGNTIAGPVASAVDSQNEKASALQEAQATSYYQTEKIKLGQAIKDETDPEKISAYTKQHDDLLNRSAGVIGDPTRQEKWKLARIPDTATVQGAAGDREFSLRKDQSLASSFDQLQKLQKTAASATDDKDREGAINAGRGLIDKLEEAGYIDATAAAKRRQDWANGYAVESLQALPARQRLAALSATPEVSGSIKSAAQELGISPADLATVISYETGGTFNPGIRGGAGRRHIGLIQFGPAEQQKYGASQGQSFTEQMPAVVAYLKDRGLKPGMGLLDLYSTINAGRPGLYNASDANNGGAPGTVRDKVEQQMGRHKATALALLGDDATAPPMPGVKLASFVTPEQKRTLADTTLRQIDQEERGIETARRYEAAEVKSLQTDDWNSITTTGKPVAELTPERVAAVSGPEAAAEFVAERTRAVRYYEATNDFDTLPSQDIQQRVQTLKPAPGAKGYTADAKVHEAAEKRANDVIEQRLTDPAGSVDRIPSVAAARQAVNPNDPTTYQRLARKRIEAQEQLGIPKDIRSPVTGAEVKEYASRMRPLARGQADALDQDAVISSVVDDVQAKYGPYAKDVLTSVLRAVTLKKDAAEVMAEAMQKLRTTDSGPVVTAEQTRRLETAKQADDMAAASGARRDDLVRQNTTGMPSMEDMTGVKPQREPFQQAVDLLKANPKLLPQFIQRYGAERVPADMKPTGWKPGQPVKMSPGLAAQAR